MPSGGEVGAEQLAQGGAAHPCRQGEFGRRRDEPVHHHRAVELIWIDAGAEENLVARIAWGAHPPGGLRWRFRAESRWPLPGLARLGGLTMMQVTGDPVAGAVLAENRLDVVTLVKDEWAASVKAASRGRP